MSTVLLIVRSTVFTLRHSWPVVAFAALFVPVEFLLDNFMKDLMPLMEKDNYVLAGAGVLILIFFSLLNTLYMAGLYLIIRSRLDNSKFDYSTYRQTLRPVLGRLFLFYLVLNMISIDPVLMPLLIFIPYVDIVLLFERQEFKKAFRRNFSLLGPQPVPAIVCGIILIALSGWIPTYMYSWDTDKVIRDLYGYSTIIITVPLDVCFLVLYSALSGGNVPADFPDLAPEEKEL